MKVVDKKNYFSKINSESRIELELGCGSRKRNKAAIGIDMLDYPDVDIVGDIYDVLALFQNQSIDIVYAYHFIEHVESIGNLMSELFRILKPNGLIDFVAPHFSNPYFYSDPTHRSFFGLYTFCYFSIYSPFSRQVPAYQNESMFKLESVDLRFKSDPPFYIRYGLKMIIGKIFNSCYYMKELYEENFCYLMPCYEVCYKLRRI